MKGNPYSDSVEPGERISDGVQVVLCAVMALILLAVGIYSLLDTDETVSETEKRTLAVRPAFSIQSLVSGAFISDFDTYYSDTFPMRNWFVQQNRTLNRFYYFGGTGAQEAVVVMTDYDQIGAGGESLRQPTEPAVSAPAEPKPTQPPAEPAQQPAETTFDSGVTDADVDVSTGSVILVGERAMEIVTNVESVAEDYAANISRIANAVGDDVRVFSLIPPNAAEFYSPEDLHTGSHSQKDLIDTCYQQMDARVQTVDAYSVLREHWDEYIYFRTDHHWTGLGAYYAYTAFCQTAGLNPMQLKRFETGTYEDFVGTLYTATSAYAQSEALLENPDFVTYYRPMVDTTLTYYEDATLANPQTDCQVICNLDDSVSNKYLCFLGGDHPITWIDTDVDNDKVCLVLKESYGNAFTTFLVNHYRTVIAIDPREFNRDGKPSLDLAEFVEQTGVDDIVVINYPIAVNNSAIVRWIGRLVEE